MSGSFCGDERPHGSHWWDKNVSRNAAVLLCKGRH